MKTMVMTVLGPRPVASLGVTLPHEHVLIDLTKQVVVGGLLSDRRLVEQELEAYVAVGGSTVVDLTTSTIGRQPEVLASIAEAVGLNIVMGCGFYRQPFLDDEHMNRSSVADLANEIVIEFEHGVGTTGIRPGIIGEVGSEKYITSLEERALRASGRAQAITGMAISTHSARWPNGLAHLELLTNEGADPRAVIVGHADTIPDEDYHAALAATGCFVQFDTIRSDTAYEVSRRVNHVVALIRAGYLSQTLLSQDVWSPNHLVASGGGGYAFLSTRFREALILAGVKEDEYEVMTVDNPARALAGLAGVDTAS